MGFFKSKESTEQPFQPKCEMCELLLCGYIAGLEQQLQAALWVDRSFRFGETSEQLAGAIAKLEANYLEVEKLWQNYKTHLSEH